MKTICGSWLLPALIAFVGLEPNLSRGAMITWTNMAGGSWNTPANWSAHQVPVASDTALITAAGTYTATQNVNVTVSGLIVGGAAGARTLLNGGADRHAAVQRHLHSNRRHPVIPAQSRRIWSPGAVYGPKSRHPIRLTLRTSSSQNRHAQAASSITFTNCEHDALP